MTSTLVRYVCIYMYKTLGGRVGVPKALIAIADLKEEGGRNEVPLHYRNGEKPDDAS